MIVFKIIGIIVVVLYLLGFLGIGHFHMYYGGKDMTCTVTDEE